LRRHLPKCRDGGTSCGVSLRCGTFSAPSECGWRENWRVNHVKRRVLQDFRHAVGQDGHVNAPFGCVHATKANV
jgi:hypothetical protein